MNTIQKNTGWFPSIFDDLFTENRLDIPSKELFTRPSVNIQSSKDNFIISVAAPGLKKEDFSIEVEKDTLIVSAKLEKSETTNEDEKSKKYTRKEFSYGSFKRTFNLPEMIDTEMIKAKYDSGILTVTLPVMEAKKESKKKVEIS